MRNYRTFFILAFFLGNIINFYGCKNKNESILVGHYKVHSSEIMQNTLSNTCDLSALSLDLKADKTFIFHNKNTETHGTWEVEDIKEITGITFFFKDNQNGIASSDGTFSDEKSTVINLWNPKDFYCPYFNKISFKRIGAANK